MKPTTFLKNLSISIVIVLLCTLVSFGFHDMNIRTENIMLIYLIGVLLIVMETRTFLWGIVSSFTSILMFNYLFTAPTFSFEIDDFNYIITIVIFLIVSIIIGSLVNKLQQHMQKARESAASTSALYEITKSYLTLSGMDTIIRHTLASLKEAQGVSCVVFYVVEGTYQRYEQTEEMDVKEELARWCFEKDCDCGCGTSFCEQEAWCYHPLRCNNTLCGVYALKEEGAWNKNQQLFVRTLISQMVLAMERELLYQKQEENRIEMEKEKLRNNLLRSISHDLRTPLTGIAGSAGLICANYQELDDESIYHLVSAISSDALWLNQLVENLLNMTRIQDGKLLLQKQPEVVDDVIAEAVRRCESRKGSHEIQVHLPQNVLLVEMDGRLIIQVLVNLIDNAIKHTPPHTLIEVSCSPKEHQAVFTIQDQGAGIDEQIKDHLFDSFVTTKQECSDARRGVGLGLSICKAIVEAHDGEIFARNQQDGKGAVFGFCLPLKPERK